MQSVGIQMAAKHMRPGEVGVARHCARLVRAADPDRYAAALFAPGRRRPGLFALYAFALEVAKTRETVSEPMLGEIRLQWWHETLDGITQGEGSRHPVAKALEAAVRTHDLPMSDLHALIDARTVDLTLESVPLADEAALEDYAATTAGQLILLADWILHRRALTPEIAAAARAAGCAWAFTGLLRALPYHAMRRQIFIPRSILGQHRVDLETVFAGCHTAELAAAIADMATRARDHLIIARAFGVARGPAFLYLALCEPYLDKLERPGFDPFKHAVEISPVRRLWRLWSIANRKQI